MTTEKFHRLSFGAHRKNIYLIEKFLEDICDYYNINNTYFAHMHTAVTEAAENAIIHGNKNNPDKKVTIDFKIKKEGFAFIVKDEGQGFVADIVPDPTDPEADFSKTEGRGLFVMKSLADEVIYHNNGNTIELLFKQASITKQMAQDRIQTLLDSIENAHKKQTH